MTCMPKVIVKLTDAQLEGWQDATKHLQMMQQLVIDRSNYIIETIEKTFERSFKTWWFEGAGEHEVGNPKIYDGMVHFITEPTQQPALILDNENQEWNLFESFPERWLTEDFEGELINGKGTYQKWFEQKDLKAKQKEAEKITNERRLYERLKIKYE